MPMSQAALTPGDATDTVADVASQSKRPVLLGNADQEVDVNFNKARRVDGSVQEVAARCPRLDGQVLPLPVIHSSAQDWSVGQEFSMKDDDPFRTKEKPQLPALLKTDPAERHSHITRRDLPVLGLELEKEKSPYQGEMIKSKTFAWELDDVFTEEQCLQLIETSNVKGYAPALQGTSFKSKEKAGGDILVYNPTFRSVYTVMYDAPELTAWIFSALEPHLKKVPVPDGWRMDHLNSFVRQLCYCHPDQGHRPHFDAMMKYPEWKYPEGHPYKEARSFMTLFIYLSDMPPSSGGSTAFPQPKAEECAADMRCHPKAGRVLIFSQNLYHSGSPIKDHIKYVLRSDLMCVPV